MSPTPLTPVPQSPPTGWVIQELETVDSTNRHAGSLPAWTAVTARSQTAGRGRHERRWVSNEGGLWLSAVVPATGPAERWAMLPLAAGLALCETFSQIGLSGHRLRWPNDIMVGPAKLAGILVERIRPETAVVGIGINLTNHPETADPALAGTVARLADLLASPPSVSTLRDLVLVEIVRAHSMLAADKPELLVSGLEHYWRPIPVRVSIREGGADLEGRFAGVDRAGRVLLATPSGQLAFAAHEVELLREISLSSDFP